MPLLIRRSFAFFTIKAFCNFDVRYNSDFSLAHLIVCLFLKGAPLLIHVHIFILIQELAHLLLSEENVVWDYRLSFAIHS